MENKNLKIKNQLDQLLNKSAGNVKDPRRDIVYGVYDNRSASLFTRLDDFLIDKSKVPLQEKAYFFHLLAVMIDAGIPLIQAINILSGKTENLRFARVLNTISYNLKQGSKFSDAMAIFPDIFGDMEIGIVKSGEAAGSLDKMLMKLSVELDKSNELNIKLLTASIYPIAVMTVLVLAAVSMMIFVIPSLTQMLIDGGLQEKDFPIMTKVLIGASNAISAYWWAILAALVIMYLAFKVYIGTEEGRYKWDIFKLNLPVLGELLRKVYVLRFISTLGILMESGLPVVKALEIVAQSMSSDIYELKTWEIIARVKNGEKISLSLTDNPFLFPDTVTQMLSVGEQTASIGKISEKIAAHYDQEIDHSLKRLTSLFEPIMIVLVGATVAILALAILTPIFQLSSLV